MNHNVEQPPQLLKQTIQVRHSDYDAGMEALSQTISLLRAWATSPHLFDQINSADRQNLFLTTLERAETAEDKLSSAA